MDKIPVGSILLGIAVRLLIGAGIYYGSKGVIDYFGDEIESQRDFMKERQAYDRGVYEREQHSTSFVESFEQSQITPIVTQNETVGTRPNILTSLKTLTLTDYENTWIPTFSILEAAAHWTETRVLQNPSQEVVTSVMSESETSSVSTEILSEGLMAMGNPLCDPVCPSGSGMLGPTHGFDNAHVLDNGLSMRLPLVALALMTDTRIEMVLANDYA